MMNALIAVVAVFASFAVEPPPRAPGPESWTFREELAAPEQFPAPAVGEGKTPWLEDRISRCFFGPIKRAPYFRDELNDDVDYYPEEYLKRLQREGVNGLWLTVEFRDLAETSFTPRPETSLKRFEKLNRTIAKCARFGIRIWLFAIEPTYHWKDDDPLVKAHPEFFRPPFRKDARVMCSAQPGVRQYLEECAFDIFSHAPDLGGIILLSHGECRSSCLSDLSPVGGGATACPDCRKLQPWEIHANTIGSVARGVRRASPGAKVISWLYHPQADPKRADWVAEVARHLPEGVALQYNFESGIVATQEKRDRVGGDYWLSEPGPAAPFRSVAAAAKEAGAELAAKIQTCNSHELATVPYVPVPGLLYRKFKGMREAGVTRVMMCWYFGSYPGLMNRAAGRLAYSDFTESEDEFLAALAKEEWDDEAEKVAKIWKSFSDGYANYPLTNNMQYYGPFHAGVTWPLWPEVELCPLVETWQPDRPACGDMIAECLDRFSLEDACTLAKRMKDGFNVPLAVTAANPERERDLGVMKALRILVGGGADILEFYKLRATAVWRSRIWRDHQHAAGCVNGMIRIAKDAKRLTEEMIALCEADSRLGFHSEAESHQFFPARLRWRLKTLDATIARLKEIEAGLWKGVEYPESEFERTAPRAVVGGAENRGKGFTWKAETNEAGDLIITGRAESDAKSFSVAVTDMSGTVFPRVRRPDFAADGTFRVVYPQSEWNLRKEERPGWIVFQDSFASGFPLWPASEKRVWGRLNIGALQGRTFGRLIWPAIDREIFRRQLELAAYGFRRANLDEGMVEPYTLEDPLVFTNGEKVTAANWPRRRAEILGIFAHEMYGAEPPPPEAVNAEKTEEKSVLWGAALRRKYALTFRKDGTGPKVTWNLWLPKGEIEKPLPIIMGLTYNANDEWEAKNDPKARVYVPIADLVKRGYAVMSTTYAEASPDPSSFKKGEPDPYTGIFELWGVRDTNRTDDVTSLGAWAWMLSRGLDLAERIPEVDAKRTLVTGYSRLGKTAMIAAARDERFAACVPIQTGGGGTPLLKRDYGENTSTANAYFPHWYCKAFRKYREAPWRDMPFDMHLFLAAIAPRPLMVLGFDNFWYDPKGERLSTEAATPAWTLLGAQPPEYHCRDGVHGMNPWDWDHILRFAAPIFGMK